MTAPNYKSEEYTGTAAEMRESPWLASEDLLDSAVFAERGYADCVILKVKKNLNVPFADGDKKTKFSLVLKGIERELLLNATNRNRLKDMHGPRAADWIGKTIRIYVFMNSRRPGKPNGPGIRIKYTGKSVEKWAKD